MVNYLRNRFLFIVLFIFCEWALMVIADSESLPFKAHSKLNFEKHLFTHFSTRCAFDKINNDTLALQTRRLFNTLLNK